MKKELPVVNIGGDDFLFDIEKIVLIDKMDQNNLIYFDSMTDYGSHYAFEYNKSSRNYGYVKTISQFNEMMEGSENSDALALVTVPRIGAIDPEGMCKKYGCTKEDIAFKTDFEIMVDQIAFNERMQGIPVTIDLGNKRYEVDVLNNTLVPQEGGETILLNEFQYDYFMEGEGFFLLFYNQKTCTVEDPLRNGWDLDSDNLLILEMPMLRELDPIGSNFLRGTNPRFALLYADLKMHKEAKSIPLSTYGINAKKIKTPSKNKINKRDATHRKKRRSKGL